MKAFLICFTELDLPRFHGTTGPPVKVFFVIRHERIILPGLGYHCHHSLWQGPVSAHDKKFKDIVKTAWIGHVGFDHRVEFCEVIPQHRVGHNSLPGLHQIHIAPEGIDLTIVSQKSIGMGAFPTWKSVRRKPKRQTMVSWDSNWQIDWCLPCVYNAKASQVIWVGKVIVVLPQLAWVKLSFVDQGFCW